MVAGEEEGSFEWGWVGGSGAGGEGFSADGAGKGVLSEVCGVDGGERVDECGRG